MKMEYINSYEQLVKEVVDRGNSGGVYLPKSWVGQRVIIKPLSVNEYVLNAISPYMKDITGVYLYGSYARHEQQPDSDIDVLILASNGVKLKKENSIDYRVINVCDIKNAIREEPISMYPMIKEAVPIMNAHLLEELKVVKIYPKRLSWITRTTDIALKMNKGLIELGEDLDSVIYSLIMRLRGLYLTHLILTGKKYSHAEFESFVMKRGLNRDPYNTAYAIYRTVRDNKALPKKKALVEEIRKLYDIVSGYNNEIKKGIKDAKTKKKKGKKNPKGRRIPEKTSRGT